MYRPLPSAPALPLAAPLRPKTLRAMQALALTLACAAAQATTYQYTGAAFSTRVNYTAAPCTAGSCANFTPGTSGSGTFSTAAPLAASLPPATDIAPDITQFSFSDGLTSYSSSDPSTHLMRAYAATDAAGNITAIDIYVQRWQTGSPQAVGGRVDTLVLGQASANAFHNSPCNAYGSAPKSSASPGVPCTGIGSDANVSYALVNTGALPLPVASPAAPASIPTMHPIGLLLTGLLACAMGAATLRTRSQRRPHPPRVTRH